MTSPKHLFLLAPLVLGLAACSFGSDEKEGGDGGTKIEIGDAAAGEKGKFSINADGFAMSVDVPEFKMDSDDFQINDVALYPGTKITNLNIEADKPEGDTVTIGFKSPAAIAAVLDYYEGKMKEKDFTLTRDDKGLRGTTDEDEPFTLTVEADGDNASKGSIIFSNKK